MGASLTEAQAAMAVAASQKASHSHPAKADRLHSIALGWNTANGQSPVVRSQPSGQNVDRPVLVRRPVERPAIDTRSIAFDVEFASDEGGIYFITDKGHLINVDDGSAFVIGSLSESNKRGYRLMLSDKNYNYLYIASGGRIENGSGKLVGSIRKHE